jgi:hypothetical protein
MGFRLKPRGENCQCIVAGTLEIRACQDRIAENGMAYIRRSAQIIAAEAGMGEVGAGKIRPL